MPHKYLVRKNTRDAIFGIDLARIQIEEREDVPVVATTEEKAIVVWWWSQRETRWRNFRIEHGSPGGSSASTSGTNTWNWSKRASLAGMPNGPVFCVYKRASRLTIARFTPRDDNGSIELTEPERFIFPASDLGFDSIGFWVWAGVHAATRSLILVCQAVPTGNAGFSKLILFAADARADLAQQGSWHSPLALGEGGYDFDVLQDGDVIAAVYREASHAITIPVNSNTLESAQIQTVDFAALDPVQTFTPLKLCRINLEDHAIEHTDVPGGEHPQIHKISPPLLTFDRIVSGTVDIEKRELEEEDNEGFDFEVVAHWKPTRIAKMIWREKNGRTEMGRLFEFFLDKIPRDLYVIRRFQHTVRGPLPLRYASSFGVYPVFLAAEPAGPDSKTDQLEFLRHTYGALIVSRFVLATGTHSGGGISFQIPAGDILAVDRGAAIWDINHRVVPAASIEPEAYAENLQFVPDAIYQSDRRAEHAVLVFDDPFQTDPTIGGTLVAERGKPNLSFYAYTDLGDGGGRVVFDPMLPPPVIKPPGNPKRNEGPPLPEPGRQGDLWVPIVQTSDWEEASIPGYTANLLSFNRRSLAATLHNQIDSLIAIASSLFNTPASPVDLSDDMVLAIQDMSASNLPISDPVSSEDGEEPVLSFQITPGVPRTGGNFVTPRQLQVSFSSALTPAPAVAPALAWSFTFQDPSPPPAPFFNFVNGTDATMAQIQGSFAVSGTIRVQLTAILADGSTRSVSVDFNVQPSLVDQLWTFHLALNGMPPVVEETPLGPVSDMPVFAKASLRILKYVIDYDPMAAGGQIVRITSNASHNTQYQFEPKTGAQGVINYRLPLQFTSSEVTMTGTMKDWLKVDSVDVTVYYGRRFTPAILMSDRRKISPITGAWWVEDQELVQERAGVSDAPLSSCLAAKPVGDTWLEAGPVIARLSLTDQAKSTLGWIGLAIFLGIAIPAILLIGVIPGVLVADVVTIAFLMFTQEALPAYASSRAATGIRKAIPAQKQALDKVDLLQYAGEGLAEAIALRVIKTAQSIAGGEALPPPVTVEGETGVGRNRFRDQLWQMILVTHRQCQVLINPGESRADPPGL
jgi:hypothetical protein